MEKSKNSKTVWTVLGILMLIGIIIALFFWLRKKKEPVVLAPGEMVKNAAASAVGDKVIVANLPRPSGDVVITNYGKGDSSGSITTKKSF